MKKNKILAAFFVTISIARAAILYDIDFSSPPQKPGQIVQVGPSSSTPTSVVSGTPTVVSSFGSLINQPLRLDMIGNSPSYYYDQIELSVPTFSDPILNLEFDFSSNALVGSKAQFAVFFDTPSVRNIYLNNNGQIRLYWRGAQGFIDKVIGSFSDTESFHLSISINQTTGFLSVYKDYSFIGGNTVTIDERIQDIRLSYGLVAYIYTPDSSAVAIDNIVLSTIPEPSAAAAVVSMAALLSCLRSKRKLTSRNEKA